MRTWGRTTDEYGNKTWVEVATDANGYNDAVYITDLCQCLLLNLAEDPFFADYGIPAQRSVMTQIFPDYYTYYTQSKFTQYFVLLIVKKLPSPTPTYSIRAVTHSGAIIETNIPI